MYRSLHAATNSSNERLAVRGIEAPLSFLSFGLLMLLSPYTEPKHDYVARVCQVLIFFALLAGVVLKGSPSAAARDNFGYILTLMCAVPLLLVAFRPRRAS